MTPSPRTIECSLPGHRGGRGRPRPSNRPPAAPRPPLPAGRVPRVSRLMALALRFQGLLQQGLIADYATLARLGHVSRARVSQIMNLLVLAPDIQEALLFLPRTEKGRDPIHRCWTGGSSAVSGRNSTVTWRIERSRPTRAVNSCVCSSRPDQGAGFLVRKTQQRG
jgi:hypothetical protein